MVFGIIAHLYVLVPYRSHVLLTDEPRVEQMSEKSDKNNAHTHERTRDVIAKRQNQYRLHGPATTLRRTQVSTLVAKAKFSLRIAVRLHIK